MNELELSAIGDRLQVAWRADRRAARRRSGILGAGAVVTVLVLAGAAIAAGVLPISVSPSSGKPQPAALVQLRSLYPRRPGTPPQGWANAPVLELDRALVIARISDRATGPLTVIVIPARPRGMCLDAARPDGSPYMSGCSTFPHAVVDTAGRHSTAFGVQLGVDGSTGTPPLNIALHRAPPGSVRVDVRARDASKLPSVLNHGWLVYVNQHPGPAVLVRFYDRNGRRLLSYYGA
jgi:hypothetical protein